MKLNEKLQRKVSATTENVKINFKNFMKVSRIKSHDFLFFFLILLLR